MFKALKIIFAYLVSTLILLEVVGLFVGDNGYFWLERNLFVSQGAFRAVGDEGLWTYPPETEITTAATYHLSGIEQWLEYRCDFETNEFGLIKTNLKKGASSVDYLVLGDSFTEGHGGCPWLTKTSLEGTSSTVLNGGLQGVGIASFEKLEAWLSPQIDIKNLVIIVISDDFKRFPIPGQYQKPDPCLDDGECAIHRKSWWGIKTTLSNAEILELGKQRYQFRDKPLKDQIKHTFEFRSFTYRLFHIFKQRFSKQVPNISKDWAPLFEQNFAALSRLNAKYPELQILILPQKDEVGIFGRTNYSSTVSRAYMENNNIEYTICPLGRRDFMKIDGHPNKDGYQKVFRCLEDMIEPKT